MAKRNEIGSLLGGLDRRDAGNADDISFFGVSLSNPPKGLGLHENFSTCDRDPLGVGFLSDIHHVGLACGIKVGQLGHSRYDRSYADKEKPFTSTTCCDKSCGGDGERNADYFVRTTSSGRP